MANACIDWIGIKNEYITTGISQRKLAKKHNVSFNTLKDRANKGKWADEKKEQHNRIVMETQQKTVEKIVESEVNRISELLKLTDAAQKKIGEALEQLTIYVDMFGNTCESDVIDVGRLKKLISGLKDIKEILCVDNSLTTDAETKQSNLLNAIQKAVQNAD